ncbi:MAG: HAD family hydrolase [Rikenellaceae bacterium]|nr:HAD family hydrolase [Rikenellaceae bacterium]
MTRLVIFDLDGTLLNTIDDLATATNWALERQGYPTHELAAYPFFVGNGVARLLERALPDGARTPENVAALRRDFVDYYDAHGTDLTRPYPGIPELIAVLRERGVMLAVASNKYQEATARLIGRYFPATFRIVLGQREGVAPKPDPSVIWDILAATGVAKGEILYVGDSGVDMQTAANAGLASVGVTWGFRPRAELEENGAMFLIDRPEQLLTLL